MRIDIGVYTPVQINLSNFDFTNVEKVILTIKNAPDIGQPIVAEREYLTAKVYDDVITPEESVLIRKGAVYDFDMIMTDGKRYKICDNRTIEIRRGCGHCQMKLK